MKNGLYKLEFRTPLGSGGGVAVLRDGSIRGGDSAIAYIGDYAISGDQFKATVNTQRHTTEGNMPSVFGKDSVTVVISGRINGDNIALVGESPAAPGVHLEAFVELIAAD